MALRLLRLLRSVLRAARLPFLALTPVSVALDDRALLPRVLAYNLALVLVMPSLMVVGGWCWPG